MTLQKSVAVRNAALDAEETAIGASPILQLRSGAPPADCAAAAAGTLLAALNLPADFLAAASGGSKAKSGTWSGSVSASGKASHFRLLDSGGSTCHLQGLAPGPWLPNMVYAVGDHVLNDPNTTSGKVYKATAGGTSASSGGPTGTGGSITDNGVTWQYVQAAAEMPLDGGVLTAGQALSVTGFTLTAGNA